MLSLDLFDSKFEKKLHEGALDDTIVRTQAHLMEPLSRRAADIRTQIRNGKLTGAELDKLEKEYEDLVQQRQDIIFNRKTQTQEQQVPSKQDPFAYVKPEPKGIGDIQDPKAKMAQLQQRAKKGPLANVGAGLKAFIKGEPEPMDEEQELGRRGIGMANMKALQATVEKGFARTIFQFPNIKYVVGEDDTDKMADYYNGQDAAGRTNFVYNVLGDGMKFVQLCRELGIQPTPVEPQQPELPGMPQASPQGQLPLQEKKKSNSDDLEAGDIKVARELQKIRAQYPAARSDVEAVARAEIDSTERSQRQLSAIRGANEKQDALLKQLVALDQEQGREISGLDKENNSLEQRLAQVQSTNDQLQQAISQMTGTKKSSRPASGKATIDLVPGAPADQQKVVPGRKPTAKPVAQPATPEPVPVEPQQPELPSNVIPLKQYSPPEQLVKLKKAAESRVTETVVDVKSGMARIYRRLAPKIERHRDSFLAGQLYDELENYAELHGAEREFKQMMNGARNRAHMEYDTNPGGFHNWFWFLPFADDTMTESTDDIKKRMSKLEALALAANRAGDDAKCKMYQQKIQSLKQKLSQSMNELDASGYDRYSIYMDDYDLEEKFSDLDDAVEAIEAYKRDDPKSRYADYNVRDLNGKVVWRNDAWQDVPKPGKIQFLPPKTETINNRVSTNTEQQWMQSIKQQYPGVKFAQNKTTMQIFAMVPGKGKVGTFDPRQQVKEFTQVDVLDPVNQTDTPPRRAYSIVLDGRPGQKYRAEQAWKALTSVFPKDYPGEAAEHKISEVAKKGSAMVKTGIASEDLAQTYVSKLSKFVPVKNWRIVGGSLDEATGDNKFDAMMGRISNDPWTQLNSDPNWEYEIEELVDRHIEPWLLAMEKGNMPLTRDEETLNPGWRKRYEQVANKLAQEFLTSRGLNPRDPDLVGKIRYAIDSHTDQSRNVHGQLSAYSELPLSRYQNDFDADGMTANIRDAMAGLAPRDDDDDDGYASRPRPTANPRRLDPGNMEESSKPGEYYVHTVYFKDGTKKRIRVTSDEFDVADYYTKRGQAVDHVDYDFQLHSDMTEDLVEGIKDTASATALIACLLTGGSLSGCATAPQQTSAQQVLKTGQDIGRTVQTAKRITRAGTEAEVQQELRNILRGINRPEELNHSNILRIWRRVNEPKPQQNEAREIVSKEDFVRERDRLLRMIGQETNPANKQILKSAIRQLENRAENEGWITIQSRMMREDSDSGEAVEMAIMRRMLIAHTDLIVQFGLDKVVDAIEEVAYNVGDVDEIGSSDVSGWIRQVKQILGVDA